MRRLLLGALVALTCCTPVLADIDCKGALKDAEEMLCKEPALLALDTELSALHEKARKYAAKPVVRELLKRHESWTRLRNGCITTLCLRSVHEHRIEAFKKAIE